MTLNLENRCPMSVNDTTQRAVAGLTQKAYVVKEGGK